MKSSPQNTWHENELPPINFSSEKDLAIRKKAGKIVFAFAELEQLIPVSMRSELTDLSAEVAARLNRMLPAWLEGGDRDDPMPSS